MRRRDDGFTLLEIVVAMAILSVSIVALYQAFAQALVRTRHDANLSEAILLAQSVLARAGTEWPLSPGTTTGEWENYHYSLSEDQPNLAAGAFYTIPTMRVSVSVSWNEISGVRSTSLSTLKFMVKAKP
jgi:general secretion pathway protein I